MDAQLPEQAARSVDIELHEPGPDNPRYVAQVIEFGLHAEAETLEDAITHILNDLRSRISSAQRDER